MCVIGIVHMFSYSQKCVCGLLALFNITVVVVVVAVVVVLLVIVAGIIVIVTSGRQ